METGTVTQPNAAAPQSSSTSTESSSTSVITSDFETFLQMLTTQLENQDPLNPLESTEFATQLATFSGVEQQVLTNDLLTSLTEALGATEIGQLANWVGQEARAPMPVYFDGSPVTLAPNPASGADRMALLVRNESGTVVQRLELLPSNEQITWAGVTTDNAPLPQGLYSFTLESSALGEVIATDAVDVYAEVREARVENGEVQLVFDGGATAPVNAVTALRNPEAGDPI